MLWNNINFWRVAAFVLFAAVLALSWPYLGLSPRYELRSSDMQVVQAPEYGARFTFTVANEGKRDGEAYVTCHLYLDDRGGDTEDDYVVLGINKGDEKSGELFIPLRPGRTVHDWRIEVS
jgi:hypothetical protein